MLLLLLASAKTVDESICDWAEDEWSNADWLTCVPEIVPLDYNQFGSIRPLGVKILSATPVIRQQRVIRARGASPVIKVRSFQ